MRIVASIGVMRDVTSIGVMRDVASIGVMRNVGMPVIQYPGSAPDWLQVRGGVERQTCSKPRPSDRLNISVAAASPRLATRGRASKPLGLTELLGYAAACCEPRRVGYAAGCCQPRL